MSSSGLIYAVIVGAWAAYLVPMWLRRQDELNEARPTERFSTAIRLLSGRAAMERRYAKDLRERTGEQAQAPSGAPAVHDAPGAEPDGLDDLDGLDDPNGPDARDESISSVDVRAYSAPPALTEARIEVRRDDQAEARPSRHAHGPARDGRSAHDHGSASRRRPASAPAPAARRRPAEPDRATRARRSKVLARRRRTTVLLFLAFTAGAVAAAVGGLRLLWAPAVPAVLLSVYIAHLRVKERRRFAFTMDRRRAEAAALRLRETRGGRRPATA
ncbi:divisome protein SepX/GlpR, partial [Streptomyces montanisoli]|nr:hypothetical protein [Streptomyces montanisoli]